jgi:hypothetical protein
LKRTRDLLLQLKGEGEFDRFDTEEAITGTHIGVIEAEKAIIVRIFEKVRFDVKLEGERSRSRRQKQKTIRF